MMHKRLVEVVMGFALVYSLVARIRILTSIRIFCYSFAAYFRVYGLADDGTWRPDLVRKFS
jgi:hypothetical protein